MPQDDLFGGPSVEDVRIDQMLEEVNRELAMRRHVYPDRIAAGKMTEAQAQRQMLRLEAVQGLLARIQDDHR